MPVVKQLKEVLVTAQKPILEQSLDKLIYNVDADPESKTASALDILRKIPLLTLDADDNLQLNGNNNYRVLINGKKSSLFQANSSEIFRNLSASAIKTIEVITVPPSRYEAEGVGGIINITTYKKTLGGYNGGFSLRASDPEALSGSGNLTANVGRFDFSGNFMHTHNTSPPTGNTLMRQDKIRHTRLAQSGSNSGHNRSQNGGGEISYDLDDHNILSVGLSANQGSGHNDFHQEVVLLNEQGDPAEAYRRLNTARSGQHGSDLNVSYQRTFKKNEAQEFSLSYQRSRNTASNGGYFTLQPLADYKPSASLTDNEDGFREQTLQADYTQPVRKHTLELGVSVVQRQNSSAYFYKDQDTLTGSFVLNKEQSNSFHYREGVYAGYTSLNLKMGRWGLNAGVRLEEAKIDAHFITSGTVTQREYTNLIPSINLSRQLKGISTLRLSYTQRLQRPGLYYLDPYVDRTDPWNISYGNPYLQPALAHVFNLAYNVYIKKTAINLGLYRQFTNNSIQQFTELGTDTVARTTFGNIGQNRNTNGSLGLNTTLFKILNLSLNGNANYIKYTSTIKSKIRISRGLTYSTSVSANLRLKTWRIGSSMGYNAPNILVQGKTASYISNSATLNKSFLKNNKASIGFSVSSPFCERRRSFTEINDPTFDQLSTSYSVIRRFSLSLNYRFVKVQGK